MRLQYCSRNGLKTKPFLIILENVRKLNLISHKRNDLNTATKWLNGGGYYVLAGSLGANDYCIPQSRGRIYIIAFLVSNSQVIQESCDDLPAWFKDIRLFLNSMQCSQIYPFDNFILPADHDVVTASWSRQTRNLTDTGKHHQWHSDHMHEFKAAGFDWPPGIE